MNYKIIVYKKHIVKIATNKGISQKPYFERVAIFHDIPKSEISRKTIEIYQHFIAWETQTSVLLEDEEDTYIDNLNAKVQKYWQLINC